LGHLLTLIEARPWENVLAMPLAADDGRNEVIAKAWRAQAKAHSHRPEVLVNAAAFLQHWNVDEAKRLLEAAIALEPDEWKWRLRLGRVMLNSARACSNLASQRVFAGEAMTCLKKAAEIADLHKRDVFLDGLIEGAFLSGDHAQAKEFAQRAIGASGVGGWERGNVLHIAHTVLGALAYEESDILTARYHLEESLMVPKSPQFQVRGPSPHLLLRLEFMQEVVDSYLLRWQERFGLPAGWTLRPKAQFQHV
jgi:tetratricopeptide (TPR) repeat protein